MSRPLRIDLAGGVYHITARGNQRGAIYIDDVDRSAWLELTGAVCERYNWRVHAWCLMTNHYHLVVETPDGNLSKGMRQLNGVYTQRFNRRHRRVGHLFQGRYTGILVEKESYLLELARYVVLNPVRARMVDDAGDWPWSSFGAMTGESPAPDWLETDWLLGQFAATRRAAVAAYRNFVRAGVGLDPIWRDLKHQLFLGGEAFVENLQANLDQRRLREVPRIQRRRRALPLAEFEALPDRHEAMARAYLSGGYTQQTIADHFGVHYATVSRAVKRFESAGRE